MNRFTTYSPAPARSRDTDVNGVLKYLLEASAVTAVSSQDDDEE